MLHKPITSPKATRTPDEFKAYDLARFPVDGVLLSSARRLGVVFAFGSALAFASALGFALGSAFAFAFTFGTAGGAFRSLVASLGGEMP